MSALVDQLRASGLEVQDNVSLAPFTTYRVGGTARWFLELNDPGALEALALHRVAVEMEVRVVGNGSNMLVSDDGFDGLALHLGPAFTEVEVSDIHLRAGGAAALPVVARRSVAAGLTGFEWAVGVPGSIGGAVRMNAGGHGSDISESLVSIRAVDLRSGENREMAAGELGLGYRRSNLPNSTVVASAVFELREGDVARGEAELAAIVRWRRENQPGGHNAGSVFANPEGDSAGRLIEAAGCKGLRIGTAEVSTKHANFIQADEGGTAADVRAVMERVAASVAQKFSVELRPETHMVGFESDPWGGDSQGVDSKAVDPRGVDSRGQES